jgi:hypothetical protein
MTHDQPSSPEGTPSENDERRRKPPIIDLKATEISENPSNAPSPSQMQDEKGEEPAADILYPADSPPLDAPSSPRRSFPWLSLLMGAVGGALTSAVLLAAFHFLLNEKKETALAQRIARVETTLRDMSSQTATLGASVKTVDALSSRVGKLEAASHAPAPSAPDAAATNRLSSVEGEVRALAQSMAALGRRTDEALALARETRERAEGPATAASERPTAPASDSAARERMQGELTSLATRLSAAEGTQKEIAAELAKRASAQVRDVSARLAASAVALNGAVERGDPFAPELAAVKAGGGDPKLIASLEPFAAAGMPSAAALAQDLSSLMPSLVASVERPSSQGGFLEKLHINAGKLVRIRPMDVTAGRDPEAALARAQHKAGRGDLPGAVAELREALPSPSADARAWIEKAQARTTAVESSRKLAASALAGLSR